jgi:hypothetical protein
VGTNGGGKEGLFDEFENYVDEEEVQEENEEKNCWQNGDTEEAKTDVYERDNDEKEEEQADEGEDGKKEK